MKKLLLIAYHFPPDAAIGAVRSAKFAKYLPEFGWNPIIYTLEDRYYKNLDFSKLEPQLHHLPIYRTKLIPGLLDIYAKCRSVGRRTQNSAINNYLDIVDTSMSYRAKINQWISSFLWLPDEKQGWIVNIVIDGYRILKKHKIDIFMTSGPPMTTHLGGLILKLLTRSAWIADFRDPWTTNFWKLSSMRTPLSDKLERWLEHKVALKADALVSTTQSVTDYFRSIIPPEQRDKCVTITNGFDANDFGGIAVSACTANQKIRISYAGSLYSKRDPEPFFIAMQELICSGKIDKDRIQIDLIGDCSIFRGLSVQGLIEKYGLTPVVRLVGNMPFRACLEELMKSNALLLFAQGQPDQIPGKVFEYLKINKPVFVLTGGGETRRLLEEFKNAFIADPQKPDDLIQKFIQILDALNNNEKHLGSTDRINEYDRRNLTEKLVGVLSENYYR